MEFLLPPKKEKIKGLVDFFDEIKGFGFIKFINDFDGIKEEREIFFHFSEIENKRIKLVDKNQEVLFFLKTNNNVSYASEIEILI